MRNPRVLAVLLMAAPGCAAPSPTHEVTIDIVADDYVFVAPDTVAPGRTVLRLTNQGKVPHEVIVMKLRPGASVADLFAAQQRDESFRSLVEGGNAVLFAQPGATGDGRLAVYLEPGRDYALWCNFQDGEGMPAHSTMGMFKQIHVDDSGDAVAGAPPARRVVVDVDDYVFRLPDTLAAGVADFAMVNSGEQRHEVAFGRLTPGTTTAFFFDEYLKGNAVDSLYDDDGAILTSYGGDPNDFTVRIELMAGRSYVLVCEFSDTPEAPIHAKMGMFKGFVVR